MKNNRHKKTPSLAGDGALVNEINFEEEIVMGDISTAVSNVIPFKFGKQQVRTLLINDQPWFVAADVCASLAIGNVSLAVNGRADRDTDGLDEDEKGIATVNTPSGAQEMLVVNESGLYALIFKSRKAEAKRFKKWVTAEVLPAIRKQGSYQDSSNRMKTLMDDLVDMTETNALKGLARHKVAHLPASIQRSASARIYSAVHTRFSVPRIELIPASQFESACNFIAAYAVLEGEFIQAQKHADGIHLDQFETASLYMLMSRFVTMEKHKSGMLAASRALGSSALMDFFDQLHDGHISFSVLDKRRDEIYAAYKATGCEGGYVWRAAA